MPTLLVEYTGRTYVPSLPPTNRDCNDTPNEIDGAGYITATVPEESGMVFTQRLYVHRGHRFTRGTHITDKEPKTLGVGVMAATDSTRPQWPR
jgi:hypothetical protein